MNKGSPNRTRWPSVAEGGGDVRSTVDNQDNITWKEERDITIKRRFRKKNVQQIEERGKYSGKSSTRDTYIIAKEAEGYALFGKGTSFTTKAISESQTGKEVQFLYSL